MPTLAYLQDPAIQAAIVKEVEEQYRPAQLDLEGVVEKPNIPAVVAKTTDFVSQQTIAIPRILVVPKGEVKSGFKPFTLKLDALNLQPPSDELWVQHLRTNQLEIIGLFKGGIEEERLEDYVVSGLVDFDDVSYDDHADLLYDLAGQTVRHFANVSFRGRHEKGAALSPTQNRRLRSLPNAEVIIGRMRGWNTR